MLRPGLAASIIWCFHSSVGFACEVRDFFDLPLPATSAQGAEAAALEIAYPGLRVNENTVVVGAVLLPLGTLTDASAKDRLENPTILETFAQIYPLAFDLADRETPWQDPGRARHDGLFRALYGDTKDAVAADLVTARYTGQRVNAAFAVTRRHCAAAQLQAALDAITSEGAEMERYFKEIGGSFNWRRIAGTTRLSAHSFGIAVDFNTTLGGYWRWSGEAEGRVGHFENQYPEALVGIMERHGFIWGGKWHHYDGMHFEYRPELILYSRLSSSPN